MQKKMISMFVLASITSALVIACNNEGEKKEKQAETNDTTITADTTNTTPAEAPNDVVDIAVGSADHTTLVAAVKAAGLVETLKGNGPYTVFAPTNAAFNALPAGRVDGLLKPEKKADLTSILTYHVVAGLVKAADLKDGQKVKTIQGAELTVSIKDGKVKIDGATVTTSDIEGSNGIIHIIDAVLLPKK